MDYNNVTILQFQRLNAGRQNPDDDNLTAGLDILQIFEGKTEAEVKSMTMDNFDKALYKYRFLVDGLPEDVQWLKTFELNGKTYKVVQTPELWDVGQFISMGVLIKDKTRIIDNCHLIVSTMTRDGRTIHERANEFQEGLSIMVAYPLAVFFCAVMAKLWHDLPHYFQGEGVQTGLAKNGGGTIL